MYNTRSSLKRLSKSTLSTSTLSQSKSSLSVIATPNNSIIPDQRECVLFPSYAFKNPDDPNEWIIRTKGWALSLKKAGPKQKVLKGIARSVAGKHAASEISNKMFENRFKYFLAKGKRNRQFKIEVIGSASCTERHEQQEGMEEDISSSSSNSSATTIPSTSQDYFSPRCHSFIYNDNNQHDLAKIQDSSHIIWNKIKNSSLEHDGSSTSEEPNRTRPFLAAISDTSYLSSIASLNYTASTNDEEDEKNTSSDDQRLISPSDRPYTNQNNQELGGVTLKSNGTGFFTGQFNIHDNQICKWHSKSNDQQQQDTTNRIIRIKSEPTTADTNDIKKSSMCNATFGIVNLVDSKGVSVISDIDDTIKDTRVLAGARVVLKNTFYNPTRAVDGMADVYSQWYKHGASFHYVSNSPFQLVDMLNGFMSNHHFPPGSFHLRSSVSLLKNLVEKPGRSKRDYIVGIMRDFPRRKFILIGDSGEIDLEIYTRIATEFPGQVLKIFIRDVTTAAAAAKMDEAKSQLNDKKSKRFQKLSNKSASIPSFFISNSLYKSGSITLSLSRSTSDIDKAVDASEQEEENDERLSENAIKLAEMVLEDPLTGHQPVISSDMSILSDIASATHHQPPSYSILQLYTRLSEARKRLENIDIILFQDAKELNHDREIQQALAILGKNHKN